MNKDSILFCYSTNLKAFLSIYGEEPFFVGTATEGERSLLIL